MDETTIPAPTHIEACVLFVDISDSTKIYEELGDQKAREITQQCLNMLIDHVVSNQGRVVKTIGDEVMCHFQNSSDAAYAALAMEDGIQRQPVFCGVELSIRIGFHFGSVLEENGDLFGDTVNTAARVVAAADAGQILVDKNTRDQIAGMCQSRWIKKAWLKGKAESVDLYELVWDECDQTIAAVDPSLVRQRLDGHSHRLQVVYGSESVVVDQKNARLTVGRSQKNRFILHSSVASRVHLRIEFRPPNHFVIVDQSTNGTVVDMGGQLITLQHEELALSQAGSLKIGREKDVGETIHFSMML